MHDIRMRKHLLFNGRLGAAAGAVLVSVALLAGYATPARAVSPQAVFTAIKTAYEAYKMLNGGELTLAAATRQIINAIEVAKTDLIREIDRVAVADVKSCARHAVIDLVDIRRMSPDTLQAYARDTTKCVTDGWAYIIDTTEQSDRIATDRAGHALNIAGPIALLARKRAGFTTPETTATLIEGNTILRSWLTTSCAAVPLWGDAEPGEPVEVTLSCTAFNGTVGTTFVYANIRRGQPLPAFDFTVPKALSLHGTSHPIAGAALAELTS